MDIFQLTELLGNVGEFVGAIAVVVTLIYLAHEVRESRRASTTDALLRLQEGFTSVNALPAKDPRIARLMRLIFSNQLNDLDEDEQYQIATLFFLWVNQFAKAAQAHKMGVINDNQLTIYANDAKRWFGTAYGQSMTQQPNNYDVLLLLEYLSRYTKSIDEMQEISTRPEDWF